MSSKFPSHVLSVLLDLRDNIGMEMLLRTLTEIGLPAEELCRVREYYKDNEGGLWRYLLYMSALLEDWHEYLD